MRRRITKHFLKGWRTRIMAIAVFLLGVIEAVDPYFLAGLFGYHYHGWVLAFIAVLTFLLRQITDSPPGATEGNTETWYAPTEAPKMTEAGTDE